MGRAVATVFLFVSLLPTEALAQTLTVEIDAVLGPAPAPRTHAAPAVVVVRPLEDERYASAPRVQEPPWSSVEVRSAPPPEAEDDARVEAWGGFGSFFERLDLSGADLVLGEPEVGALRGLRLSPGWAGNRPLHEAIVGGAMLHVGARFEGVLRGPEVRFFVGGGDVEGAFNPVDGAPAGIELAMRSIFMLRLELALGLQLELGAATPYVQAIGSVGGAWIDVAVRDAGLGALGTETIEVPLFGAGFEVGVDVEVEEGMALGFALRANLAGTPSLGGAFRLSWGGE